VSVPCHRINKLGAHAHHHDRGAAVAILANGTYFLDNLVYGNVMLAHSSILTVCDNAG